MIHPPVPVERPLSENSLGFLTTIQDTQARGTPGHLFVFQDADGKPGGAYTVSPDGISITHISNEALSDWANSKCRWVSPANPVPRAVPPKPKPLVGTVLCSVSLEVGVPVPGTVRALSAREAALRGDDRRVAAFTHDVLGLWRGGRWQEAVSTALMGDWASSLQVDGTLGADSLCQLKSEARLIHRQLRPLWERRTSRSRILLLDTPLTTDGITLHDLVATTADLQGLDTERGLDDDRLTAVLRRLHPRERAVALAWAQPSVATWTEAARCVGLSNAEAFGERVRRKLKRLGAQHANRIEAAAATTRDQR